VLSPRASDGRDRCCGSFFPSSSGRLWAKRRAKAILAIVSVSTTAAPSGVVVLLEAVLLGYFLLDLCLPGENLSSIFKGATTTTSTLFPSWGGVLWEVMGSASLVVVWLVRRR
jgi:hypothetical protein